MSFNNRPVVREQHDDAQDEISYVTGLDCTDSPDKTRQEFRDDADINKLLSRYGIGAQPQRVPIFQEIDYTLDLQTAIAAAEQAKHAHSQLPKNLRERYPTVDDVLNAVARGQLRFSMDRTAIEEVPSAPPAPEV